MIRQSATYQEIQKWVRKQYRFVPQTCWIAHCKELNRLPVKSVYKGTRVKPCPPDKRAPIEQAFRHFGMLT